MRITSTQLALLGPVLGAALALFGAWVQRRWKQQDDAHVREELREQMRSDARRSRLDQACFGALDQVVKIRTLAKTASSGPMPDGEFLPLIEELTKHVHLVPGHAERGHFMTMVGIAWYADHLARPPQQWYHLVFEAMDHVSDCIGALLRDEAMPAPPVWFDDYAAAYAKASAVHGSPAPTTAAPTRRLG